VVGHAGDAAVAARIADVSEADAGIARGALDHRASRWERTLALGLQNDRARGAVLDRAAGIHELRLAEDLTAGLLAHPLEQNEGRVADRADEAAGGAAGRSALRAHAGTPGALARGSGAAPASVAAKAATSPSIRIEGGSIRCACASATMFEDRKSTRLNSSHRTIS